MSDGVPAAFLFDLDGVIVDTAKYHFLAWRDIADAFGFIFTPEDNERLKGVSRQRSLEILLEIGGIELDEEKKTELAERKNAIYLGYIAKMTPEEILPGAEAFLIESRARGLRVALVSASKNAPLILSRLHLASRFDAVVDGNRTEKTKPDPEGFLLAAKDVGVPASACVVFEDAEAGIAAGRAAGMFCVGIGTSAGLGKADMTATGLDAIRIDAVIRAYDAHNLIADRP